MKEVPPLSPRYRQRNRRMEEGEKCRWTDIKLRDVTARRIELFEENTSELDSQLFISYAGTSKGRGLDSSNISKTREELGRRAFLCCRSLQATVTLDTEGASCRSPETLRILPVQKLISCPFSFYYL